MKPGSLHKAQSPSNESLYQKFQKRLLFESTQNFRDKWAHTDPSLPSVEKKSKTQRNEMTSSR